MYLRNFIATKKIFITKKLLYRREILLSPKNPFYYQGISLYHREISLSLRNFISLRNFVASPRISLSRIYFSLRNFIVSLKNLVRMDFVMCSISPVSRVVPCEVRCEVSCCIIRKGVFPSLFSVVVHPLLGCWREEG